MSIRIKLISMFLALALIPLIFVSVLTFHNYKDSLQATRLTQLKDAAAFKAERIAEYFSGLKSNLEIAQSLYNIKQNLPVLNRLFRDPTRPEFIAATKMLDGQLQKMQVILGLTDIMLVDLDGRIVYASNPKHYQEEFERPLPEYERDPFVEGKKGIYVSDVFRDQSEDNRIEMMVTAPAVELGGTPVGVIVFEVDMAPINALLQDNTGLGQTGETLVGKKSGPDVIFLSDLKYTPEQDLNKHLRIGVPVAIPLQKAVMGETGEGESIDYRGEKIVAAWNYIPSLGWGVVAKMDSEEALASVHHLKHLVLLILLIVAALGGIMAFSLARSIADPIKKLSEGAALIGAGNLDHKVAISSKDEVGQLSRAFDKMTGNLKEVMASRDELNREIAERKQAELALRKSQRHNEFLANIIECSSQPFGVGYPDGKLGLINKAFERLTGYSGDELRSIDWAAVLTPPEWREIERHKLTELSTTDLPVRYEKEYVKKDGTRVPIELLVHLVKDADGNPLYFYSFLTDITARKQAEAALREREEQLQMFVDHAPAAIAMFDTHMRYVAFSQRWLSDYGLSGQNMIGRSHYDVFPEIPEAWRAAHRRSLSGAVERAEEDEFVRADGSTQWIRWEARPWHNVLGTVGGIVIFSEDITERKNAEEALRRERNNLQTIFDVVNVGMLLIDEKGVVKRANSTICTWGIEEILFRSSRKPGDIIGCVHALSDPAGCGATPNCDVCPIRNTFISVLRTGNPVHGVETEMELSIDQKPMRLWVEISVDPLVLDGKRHAIIAINNIDERKRAETALSLLGEELQTILDSVSASIFFKDKENRFLRVNAAFSKLMGMPKDQLQNRSIFDFYPREQAEAFWRDDKDVILSGKSKLDIIEPMQVADQTRWMQTDKVPYFNDQGEIVGVIGFAVDITERKRMDDELRKLNRTLRALSNSNRAILLAENESEYLNEACRIIVNDCGHLMTWIGFAEDDEAKTVRLVAEAGFEEGYLNTLNITWADTERGRGPTGTAIRTGKPSLCKNMLTDPKFEPWRAEALKRGYKASAVFPLIANSRSFGAVSIYSKYADPFSEDEIRLLQELVDNIAYGITVIKIRAEQVEAEAAVHRSLQRFELLAQTASELLQSSQPTELVDSLCRKVMESLDCQTFFNFLVDEKLGRLHLNAFAGIPEEDARRIEWLDFGIAVCGCAARDGCRIVAEHIPTTPDQRTELVKSFGIKAYACHPLLGKGGKVIGTLSFGTRNRETFSDEDLLLMKAVADQVSMAMIRMRDEQELQQNQLDAALAQVVTKERQRLYGVLETLPVYVVLLTPDHHISFSNKCFREHFGKDRGKCCYDLLYQRTSPCEVCETYKVLQSNAPHHWEWTGPDGRCYDVYDFPYKETDGATHIMEMGIDITDRKWAQEALLEAQQEMDRAKRLSDIGTLAATVAHELRNPLAAISMATENIRRKAQNPNLDKHLSNIALKVTESDQIINNLLFYTRLKPPHFEAINISRIIDECVEVVGKSSRKQITFAVNISDTPVKADPLQMREIFNNILNNACDAVPQEDGEINITSQAENGFIRVVVKDNGQGMSPESIKKAFDPFFTTKAKGTGLGLSVCQQIVSFHGGTIEIESELNKGTSVIISLPTGNGTVG